jgi:hypothetical protein
VTRSESLVQEMEWAERIIERVRWTSTGRKRLGRAIEAGMPVDAFYGAWWRQYQRVDYSPRREGRGEWLLTKVTSRRRAS